MDTEKILKSLNRSKTSFRIYERRSGKYQLIAPILHEDGDMLDIYLQKSPQGEEYARICDFGMALMRLSYNYEINTPQKKKIFNSILTNNGIKEENGNLYLDSPIDRLYESIQQFAGCVQKVCNMDYWNRENIRSAFYKNLGAFVLKELREFSPKSDVKPLIEKSGYENLKTDWVLKCNKRQFYLFGVHGNDKAKDTAIALLEFKKAKLSFTSLIAHEDMDNLRTKETKHLTRNADKQYPSFIDFKDSVASDIKRLAA